MKRQVLKDTIHGSYLKRQYLEAFLLQSSYIESLVKYYADYKFFEEVNGNYDTPILSHFRETLSNSTFGQIIHFLLKTRIITSEQHVLIDSYCKKRNKVIHHLLKEIRGEEFEEELREAYEKGQQTMENPSFVEIENALDEIELQITAASESRANALAQELSNGSAEHNL